MAALTGIVGGAAYRNNGPLCQANTLSDGLSKIKCSYGYSIFAGVSIVAIFTAKVMYDKSQNWTYEQARLDVEKEMIGKYNESMMKHRIIYQTKQLFEDMITDYEEKNKLNR